MGKHESGITEALKPKLKFDTAGIGHRDKDWNTWWENAFNKAANSIAVEPHTQGVSISLSKESQPDNFSKQAFNETESKHFAKYGNFRKTSTLLNGNLIEESTASFLKTQNAEESITRIPLTDEELFKVCGGRTAHKGARHGLTLNGKLKRIAKQEEDLLNKNSCVNMLTKMQINGSKMKDGEATINNEKTIQLVASSTDEIPASRESKCTRRKNKRRMNDLTHQLNVLCNISDSDEKSEQAPTRRDVKKVKHRKKKRKKEKRRDSRSYDIEGVEKEEVDNKPNDTSFPGSKKSEQLTKKYIGEQLSDQIDNELDSVSMCSKKKRKKKKKCEDNKYEIIIDNCGGEELCGSQAKKLKRSHKSDSALQLLIKGEEIDTSDYKFQTTFSYNKVHPESNEIRDSSVSAVHSLTDVTEAYLKKKAYHLNARIIKKKQGKLCRREKIKLSKITDSLKAVHLGTDEPTEDQSSEKILKTTVEQLVATDIRTQKATGKGRKNK